MTARLYPPLERIRNELFEAPTRRPASADFSETDDDPRWSTLASDPLPDFITDLIQRQAAARQAHPQAPPAVGQIRCLSSVPAAAGESRPLARNVGVLLGAHLGGKRWSGWLVAQEVDYASDRDLVIEADDGPVDPIAGMVQTWNPVRVLIDGQEHILGKLSPLRLAAVMALAEAQQAGGGARPRPGKVYGWDLAEGIVVATGTPLGDPDDPRHAYRALYRQLAEEIIGAGETAPTAATRHNWLVRTFVRPAWTFGAIAFSAALAVHTLFSLGPRTETLSHTGKEPAARPLPPSSGEVLRITLAANGNLSILRDLLALPGVSFRHIEPDNEAMIVWLHVPAGSDVAAQAAKLPGVVAVQVVPQ
ncbi:MAG: hypothetical protein KKF85_17040 [Gammaproteobacteria bacterium]|nr:hypothetical protein [Rhodocyclaceae bacterium]MBU3910901.1 hypothetical protein [Gammaproteobacteria bacterium]MBU3988153.1 hypothetical protein [Gammaproteobacteria bacterium]MBU4006355.1 hypothetical protein [Gammaproteobacteria bacterium]MBU4097962.1 hypothetical protein [Gammaproteobacteria bacterium]